MMKQKQRDMENTARGDHSFQVAALKSETCQARDHVLDRK